MITSHNWIYWSNSESQLPEIKINHHDGETIPSLSRGHRSINHSLSSLRPQISLCLLCSPHYSWGSRVTRPATVYSLIRSPQFFKLKMQIELVITVICSLCANSFVLNGNLIGIQSLETCLEGAILMLMKADTVSTSLVSRQQTLARTLCGRFLLSVSFSASWKNMEKFHRHVQNICSHLQWHRDEEQQQDYLLLFSYQAGLPCKPPNFHPTSQAPKASPLVSDEPGAWRVAQQCFEVERLKEERPVELGWWG